MAGRSQIANIQYQVIQELAQNADKDYTVTRLTKMLGISRQAYYKGIKASKSDRQQWHEFLTDKVKNKFKEHNQAIGSYNLVQELNSDDTVPRKVGRKIVIRIMHEQGLRCPIRRKKRNHARRNEEYIQDNLINQDFTATKPNEKWLSDTTVLQYGEHGEKQVRLSGVLDLYGGRLIASHVSTTETTEMVIKTFKKAFKDNDADGVIVHTDRGAAYTSHEFARFLSEHNAVKSMSRPGTPYDNSPMERWWNDFKLRWFERHPIPRTLKRLKRLVAQGIEYFNSRVHSAIRDGKTPDEYLNDYLVAA